MQHKKYKGSSRNRQVITDLLSTLGTALRLAHCHPTATDPWTAVVKEAQKQLRTHVAKQQPKSPPTGRTPFQCTDFIRAAMRPLEKILRRSKGETLTFDSQTLEKLAESEAWLGGLMNPRLEQRVTG
jgi:hypothetical protein